jgi:preprotein translocase subunit SecG
MTTLIIGIILFLSVLSILIVLAQNSKGGGLSSQFGGSGASNIIGVKRTGDLLEKLTWGFMIAIMVLSLSTNLVDTRTGGPTNEILEKAGEQQTPLNLPPVQTPTPIVVDSTDGQ